MRRAKKERRQRGLKFRPYKPWSALLPFEPPPEARESNVVACFQNHLITVFVKQTESPIPDADGNPSKVAHLMMVWTDTSRKEEIPYRFKQQAKRELCSEMAEAVELFPADWREQEMVQTHLWVLAPGAVFPLGIVSSDPVSEIEDSVGGPENMVTKDELEVFVVSHIDGQEILEVFSSEEECLAKYKENGSEIPATSSSGIEMIGDVPAEGDGIAWSELAKAKVGNVLAKSRAASMSHRMNQESPQLFYEKYTVEDDICEDLPEQDPVGDEEQVALAMAMEEAMANRADDRAKRVRAVTEEVIGRPGGNLVSAKRSSVRPKIISPR